MKAVVCKAFGPPENLVVEEVPDLSPGDGQLLVDVHAAAVTFPDTLMLEDKYQFKADLPYIPGGVGAGTGAAVGRTPSRCSSRRSGRAGCPTLSASTSSPVSTTPTARRCTG
jgi:NADPH:quinone reductase-like Zn-dependent oxidoreductase